MIRLQKKVFHVYDTEKFILHIIHGLINAYLTQKKNMFQVLNTLNMGIFCLQSQEKMLKILQNQLLMSVMTSV